jgi:hypothetical protein
MARKFRHNGSTNTGIQRGKRYKYDSTGNITEITGTPDMSSDDIIFSGTKSSIRRIADLERNVSILAAKDSGDGGATIAKTMSGKVKFKNNIEVDGTLEADGNVDVAGTLDVQAGLTLGSVAQEVIMDVIGGMVSGNTESGITVTYDDSSNEFDFDITSAPKWETARTITLGGDLSGSVSIDGSQGVTLTATVADDSHAHIISNVDGLQTALDSKQDSGNFVTTTSSQALGTASNVLTFSANTLTLARGDGSTDTVNLSAYLDDTNAAKITSGSMASNGVATFTRDDSSTFTVDMSVLLDNDNLARITTAGWNTSNGVLTLTRNDNSTVTVDLDDRYATTSGARALAASALSVSNDTITLTKGDGTSESVTVSDANSDNYLTGASFSTSNGVLTLTRTNGDVTVDLDSRYTDNGYADTMNQHVRTTDSPSFVAVTADDFNGTATYAKYADLAERYAADAPYEEGTVLVFGGEAEVTSSQGYASNKIAGVVSIKPAVAMNSEAGNSQTHPYVALQGRVPVKVVGLVSKGDILVASDIVGTATVWKETDTDPRMTAYIGIAIEDKNVGGTGMVEVKVGK